jgi:hypothetical protein
MKTDKTIWIIYKVNDHSYILTESNEPTIKSILLELQPFLMVVVCDYLTGEVLDECRISDIYSK